MTVSVERVKDRIWLRSTSPIPNNRAERVVGASWRKRDRVWTYPLDLIICRDLRREHGESLAIGPQLWAWAQGEVAKLKELRPLLTAKDAELSLVPKRAPKIWAAMSDEQHKYQRPAVAFCSKARLAQNASQPGLGKTIETLATLVESEVRGLILVAAPKTSLRTVWEPEVNRWLPGVPIFACTGDKNRRLSTLQAAMKEWRGGNHSMVIVAVNPEMLRTRKIEECQVEGCCGHETAAVCKKSRCDGPGTHEKKHRVISWHEHDYDVLFQNEWSAFIIDETHRYILNVNLRTNRATQVGTGAMLLPLSSDPLKLALSGTPWKGKPRNAWMVGHWLYGDLGLAASYWNWAYRMLEVDDNGFGKVVGDIRDEDAFNEWCDGYMIRHTKAEMAPWLPPKSYGGSLLDAHDDNSPIGVWLDSDGKQAAAYTSMEEDAAVKLESGRLTATGSLAELTRLKQFATSYGDLVDKRVKNPNTGEYEIVQVFKPAFPSNKFDAIVEMLSERGITGEAESTEGDSKVVIASQFTEVINLYAAELRKKGIECYVLTGETSDANRLRQVRAFQKTDEVRVFLLNTMAGGVAVTLDAADDLFFIDETFVPDDQEQTEDRLHRTSKVHNVTIYYLRTRGTIDETIARQNIEKDDLQKRLLDGKRGIAFARRLLKGA